MNEWVSVKDKLPEVGVEIVTIVLYDEQTHFMTVGYFTGTKFETSGEYKFSNEFGDHFLADYWMPILELPKMRVKL